MSSPHEAAMRLGRLAQRSFSLPFPANNPHRGEHDSTDSVDDPQPNARHQASSIKSGIFDESWDIGQENVEADVLYPGYSAGGDNSKVDLAAFDEVVDRKLSADGGTLRLTPTVSKTSRNYGEARPSVRYFAPADLLSTHRINALSLLPVS